MNCRHCDHPLTFPFLDLGFAPPSNAYLSHADLARPERLVPRRIRRVTDYIRANLAADLSIDELDRKSVV